MAELHRKTVEEFRSSPKLPVVVVLDQVRSMHNVGSVFRTADAFLLEGIVLCGYTPQPPHRDIQKTALGATETVRWEYSPSTKEAVKRLRDQGYSVWAIEQTTGSIPLDRVSLGRKWATGPDHEANEPATLSIGEKAALVFGNEVTGVDTKILPLCDGCIEIPQLGMKHSLNISVAAGIVLWHLFHQYIKP